MKPNVKEFIGLCLSQTGKPYTLGAEANFSDPDPPKFDCSELVEWAAARLGVWVPDGSWNQYEYVDEVSVEDGFRIPGALLFRGVPWSPGRDHVAVSLGNFKTIEARGLAYGVNVFPTGGRIWHAAGVMPDFDYTNQNVKVVEDVVAVETDVVDEIRVGNAFYQLQADGGVRVVGTNRQPMDGVPFHDYYIVANTGQAYAFGPNRNNGEFSYPGLPKEAREGKRVFRRIFLG